jgi:hypothetical protein
MSRQLHQAFSKLIGPRLWLASLEKLLSRRMREFVKSAALLRVIGIYAPPAARITYDRG